MAAKLKIEKRGDEIKKENLLLAILVGSRDHRTPFWKGAIQGAFHKSLVAIGPVVSEEKIFF
jgi:hypothetical protein